MAYLRLEEAVGFIARHADYAGKDRLVRVCVDEIEERFRVGRVTGAEKSRLIGILKGEAAGPADPR